MGIANYVPWLVTLTSTTRPHKTFKIGLSPKALRFSLDDIQFNVATAEDFPRRKPLDEELSFPDGFGLKFLYVYLEKYAEKGCLLAAIDMPTYNYLWPIFNGNNDDLIMISNAGRTTLDCAVSFANKHPGIVYWNKHVNVADSIQPVTPERVGGASEPKKVKVAYAIRISFVRAMGDLFPSTVTLTRTSRPFQTFKFGVSSEGSKHSNMSREEFEFNYRDFPTATMQLEDKFCKFDTYTDQFRKYYDKNFKLEGQCLAAIDIHTYNYLWKLFEKDEEVVYVSDAASGGAERHSTIFTAINMGNKDEDVVVLDHEMKVLTWE